MSDDSETRTPRGPIERAPILIRMNALIQENGDGTWSASVPVLSLGVVTGPSRDVTLRCLADSLSESLVPGTE